MPLNKKLRRKGPGKVFTMRPNVPGKGQREFSTGESDYAEALKVLQKKEAEIADGDNPTQAQSKFTLAVAQALIEADYDLEDRTSKASMLRKVTHLTDYFGAQKKMATIDAAAWVLYQLHRKKAGAAPASINREQAALRRMFVLGHRDKLVKHVPYFAKLRERNRRTGFFEHGDFVRVRRQLPLELRPILDLLYYTGWRGTEATGVERRQVHEDGWIRLDPADSKEESGKGIPYTLIPPLARSIGYCLREHDRLKAEGILPAQLFVRWVSRRRATRGQPIKDWRAAYNAARVAAGVPQRLLHDFRRTAARTLARLGFDDQTGMAVTGHKTQSMWIRYNIRKEADVGAAFAGIDIQGAVRGSFRGSRLIGGKTGDGSRVRLEVVSRGKKTG